MPLKDAAERKTYSRRHYWANREQLYMFYSLYRYAFPDRQLEYQTKYRQSEQGGEKKLEYAHKWRHSPKGKALMISYAAKRRARHQDALVSGTDTAVEAIYDRATWYREQGWDVEVDHIFPLGFGWHEPANLQIIFASENSSKNCSFDFTPSVVFNKP